MFLSLSYKVVQGAVGDCWSAMTLPFFLLCCLPVFVTLMIISNASLHCLQHLQVEDLYAVLCVCLYMPVCLPHSDAFRTYIHTGAKSHSSELKIALPRRTIVMSTSQFLALICVWQTVLSSSSKLSHCGCTYVSEQNGSYIVGGTDLM